MKVITVLAVILAISALHYCQEETQKTKMSKLMRLVEKARLQDCIARVICALNCSPDGFGKEGKKVFQVLLSIQTSGSINETETRYYLNSGMTGRRYRQNQTCQECDTTFANCQADTEDLIDVASLVQLDSN